MRSALLAVVGAFFVCGAGILRPDATCAQAVEMMDSGNGQSVGYVAQFVADVMAANDRPYGALHRGSVLETMTDDGLAGLVAVAISRCRAGQDRDLRDAARDAYVSFRELQAGLGLVKN